MANVRNIVISDQGVNWKIDYEAQNTTGEPWVAVSVNFPAAFDELEPFNAEEIMREAAMSVGRNRGLHN